MMLLKIRVEGLVQGVFFRASAKEKAEQLNLSGWCRNEKDGAVSLEIEGEESSVKRFVLWCENGPENARVDRIVFERGEPEGFEDFRIKRN